LHSRHAFQAHVSSVSACALISSLIPVEVHNVLPYGLLVTGEVCYTDDDPEKKEVLLGNYTQVDDAARLTIHIHPLLLQRMSKALADNEARYRNTVSNGWNYGERKLVKVVRVVKCIWDGSSGRTCEILRGHACVRSALSHFRQRGSRVKIVSGRADSTISWRNLATLDVSPQTTVVTF